MDGDSLTATGLAIATGGGTLEDNLDGTWTYTPDLNDNTDVSFSYSIEDGATGTVAGSASLDITAVNDAPIVAAADVTGAVTELGTPSGSLTDSGTITFTDIDIADVHSLSLVTPSGGALGTLTASVSTDTTGSGTGGVVTWNYSVAASAVEYLAAGATKVETFAFNVLDGQGGSVPRTVSVTITGTNDAPQISVDGAAAFTTGGPAVAVDQSITITDVDNSTLAGATIAITNFQTGDVLTFTAPSGSGITGSYSSGESGEHYFLVTIAAR